MEKRVEQLKPSIRLGTMVTRHSFTTKVTPKLGLEFAQEALGHTTMIATQNYWARIESATKKAMLDKPHLIDHS